MARYITRVKTEMTPEAAFAYMADLTNFADWDPGVSASVQVDGNGPGTDASYDVTVKGFAGPLKLRYVTLDHQPPARLLVRADTPMLSSVDEILVEATDDGGSIVTYDAELTLKGLLRVFDLGLRLTFDRIGDRAAAGLRKALDGVEAPA